MESARSGIVKIDKNEGFIAIFPNVAKAHPDWIAIYARVNKAFTSFGIDSLGLNLDDVDVFTFANERGQLDRGFHRHLVDKYTNVDTRDSQITHIRTLLKEELRIISSLEIVPAVPALSGLVAVEKLKPHMKDLWLAMQREGFGGRSSSEKIRSNFPLSPMGKFIFAIFVKIDSRHEISNAKELIEKYYPEIKQEIFTSLDTKLRGAAISSVWKISKKFGVESLRSTTKMFTLEQLPALLKKEVEVFDLLGPIGLVGDDNLRRLADKHRWTTIDPLSEGTIGNYIEAILTGAAHFNLPDTAGIEYLLRLEAEETQEGEDKKFFNRYIDSYRAVELSRFREGYKRVGYDSVSFSVLIDAVCTIGRFNGIFEPQEKFRANYVTRIDKASRRLRKMLKKQRMNREWIDREILKLKDEFDEIVAEKSFLHCKRDLDLCLFLAQLVVLRYLGFRQQCIKKCVIGRNITFKSKTSIAFYYDPGEIKNEVMIDQTLTKKGMEGIDEIPLLIGILQKYKSGVLDVLSKHYPEQYKVDMGDAFFGKSYTCEGKVLVKRFPAPSPGIGTRIERRKQESKGRRQVAKFFSDSANEFMDFKALRDFPYSFHPHFLRAVCCDWMKKDLNMTWDEISQAMGDTEATLKKDYYDEGKKVQNAGVGFARVSRDRLALKQEKNSVSLEIAGALGSSVSVLSDQLTNSGERERQALEQARQAESIAREAIMQRDFLLRRLNMTVSDLPDLASELAVA
jgi:hypothetical protein